ncbi:MAG: DUF748 domain-containing protein [Desulfosarcinaceae bacterium]
MLYSLAGFVAVPLVVKHMLETRAAGALHRSISLVQARFNPYTLTLKLRGLTVAQKAPGKDQGAFVSLDELLVNMQIRSIFQRAVVIREIRLTAPRVQLVRLNDGRFNFSDLIGEKTGTPAQDSGPPPRIVLEALKINQGSIQWQDKATDPAFKTGLANLDVELTGLDTKAQSPPAQFAVRARSDADETLALHGQVSADPMDIKADLDLAGIVPARYRPYYHPFLNALRIDQGRIDLKAGLAWSGSTRRISAITLDIKNLALSNSDSGKALMNLPGLSLAGGAVDLGARTLDLGTITGQDGRIDLERDAKGQLNVLAAMAADKPGGQAPQPGESAQPWTVALGKLDLSGFKIGFKDHQPAQPADLALDQVTVKGADLSTRAESSGRIEVGLRWADSGRVDVGGDIKLVPLQADLQVVGQNLDLRPLQPYISDQVRLVVTSGLLGAKGRFSLNQPENQPLHMRFTGRGSLTEFKSLDMDKGTEFLSFKSLFLNAIALETPPLRLSIDEVALTDFSNRLIIAADGTANVADIFSGKRREAAPPQDAKAPPAPAPAGPDQSPSIQVKTITLQGGRLDFSDLSVDPQVRLPMQALGGRISGLDNIKTDKADVLLQGKVNSDVPLEISGQINPLIPQPYVNLKISLKGIDLSPFSPYSRKYLGYDLHKGQLTLNLTYLVDENKLKGINKVYLHQLTLGQSVPSPEATSLPIKLAIALLKDRDGNIDLDLPVQGNLNDPQFSIGHIVAKMFIHLITDIVTSPFKILGAIFGGGEELAYLNYEPGQALITPENQTKLDKLAKILYERPALNLEIQGETDPVSDTEGLRAQRFEEELKTVKLKQMLSRGEKAVPLDQISITPQEREALIRAAFAAATFPKPREPNGALKKLSLDEMQKLLFTAIAVNEGDLRFLAYQRATLAKEDLNTRGGVGASRLFVVEPPPVKMGAKGKRRVKFSFK